jgi:hypothetical protein
VEIFNSETLASGCVHSSAQSRTAFIPNSSLRNCGSYGYGCICVDHSNAGSVSPSFLMYPHYVLDCSWPHLFLKIACDV